ncbi:MAG: cupredoxin domain-containing protein [Candidatus Sungbacteria bacterium]|nr:cupredoxin domain-containing protein [Candidatus Sungbacteria bacterium]
MNIKNSIVLTVCIFSATALVLYLKDNIRDITDILPSSIPSSLDVLKPIDSKSFTIKMDETGFRPQDIEIKQGDTVVFENTGKKPHWPASNIHPSHQIFPEFDPKKEILSEEKWSFTFYKKGEWRFHDHLDPQFSGSIQVQENKKIEDSDANTEVSGEKMTTPENPKNVDAMLAQVNMMQIAKKDDELRIWLKRAGAKKVMDKLLKDSDGGATVDCHQESHAVGRIGYELYGPSVFLDGTAACHSGYYHGAMETFLKEKGTQNLAESVAEVCNKFPTSFGIFECLHGVGHGVVAYQDYDLPKALETCGMLKTDYDRNSCYGGTFMENVVAAQGMGAIVGHGTKWANNIEPHFPCNKINQEFNIQYQCYQMQTSWMLTIYGYDFAKVALECLKARADMILVCFKSFGRDAAGHTLRNPQKIVELCAKVPHETADYYEQCIIGAVNVIIDFWGDGLKQQATDLCKLVDGKGKKICYSTIAWRINDIFTAKESKKYVCETFEDGYRNLCTVN